ncbi:hypothetical protein KDN34_05450 [Shewanella yunxiaonensis]|uniref:O-antigen polymerase n=1 Tax=Shewanella yunxiaonensis TaxID=2829809 RepID=A0ABX7YWN8_9GAMM|nr:hypothetical protein [Shewanella yunxiaonensis]QUN06893.1 hypothetical protein KDN34_05450 [Shewanella yunxiaonensis]
MSAVTPIVQNGKVSFIKKILIFILLVVNFLMFIRVSFLGRDFQVGLYSYLVFFIFLPLLIKCFISKLSIRSIRYNPLLASFLLFVFFEIFSVIFYFANDITYIGISKTDNFEYNLLNCVVFILLPQVVFFIFGFLVNINGLSFVRRINTFFIFIGLLLFFFRPFRYQEYLNSLYGFGDGYLDNLRFLGILDNSMAMGSLALILTILYLFSSELKVEIGKYERYLVAFPILAVFLCLQRSAIGLLFIMLVLYSFYEMRRFSLKKIFFIIIFCLCLFAFIYYDYESILASNVLLRLQSISSGFDRFNSISQIYDVSTTLLLGLGLGASSHKGELWSAIHFFDNNYFRILSDLGLLGFMLFLSILLFAIERAFTKNSIFSLAVIVLYIIQAAFTNVFDLFYSSFFFWYIIGLLSYCPHAYRRNL